MKICKQKRRGLNRKIVLILSLLICGFSQGSAQEYSVYFRVGNSGIDPTYMNNASTLRSIDSLLTAGDVDITSLLIHGYSSPEGGYQLNKKLSEQRAASVKNYITKHHPSVPADRIEAVGMGVHWEGLLKMVDSSNMKHKAQIIHIVLNVPEQIDYVKNTSRRKQLMELGGGDPWRYMLREFFPSLRVGSSSAQITIIKKAERKPTPEEIPIIVEVIPDKPDTVETIVEVPAPVIIPKEQTPTVLERRRPFLMAVKTNLLYDALLTPNIAVEFYLGRRWSIEGEFNYAWWNFHDRHFHRIEMGGVEVRRWIGRKHDNPLTGWFVGAYGFAGNYDLMYKSSISEKSGRPGYLERENSGLHHLTYSAGLSAGYSVPIAKRLNLEFELGLGYLWGLYSTYEYDAEYRDYHYVDTKKRHYFGPTKVEISLSWLIGSGYNIKTKGGRK